MSVSQILPHRLAEVPAKYAQPDPNTLATIPKGGTNLTYMGHAEVTLALIEVDPEWTWRPLAFDVDTGCPQIAVHPKRLTMWGYLSVLGVERLCVGTCEPHKGDPEKELIGDLLRNGAMRFGIGTKLWSKAVAADPAGRDDDYNTYAPPATYSAESVALYARVHATKGTPTADMLKEFAAESSRKLTAAQFDADPIFAEQVAAILDAPVVA